MPYNYKKVKKFMNIKMNNSIIDLLKTTYDAAKYALNSYKGGDIEIFASILENVEEAITNTNKNLLPLGAELEASQCFHIIANLQNSIKNMENRINNTEFQRGGIILEFEIIPLLAELKEDLYFFTLIYPDKSRMDEYYKNEFAKNHENEYVRDGKTRFDVSLVVTAWNKLDYTRQCIESLFGYTDLVGLNCELITINHGSSDGTEEFFETLPHEKKINFKENMCTVSLTYPTRIVEGRYYVNISNDIILTKSWLENMLACMKSDNKIAMAVPTTPNISNLQAIDAEYKNLEEMQHFAEEFNVSNPDLWDERVRLCPAIVIINMDIINQTGLCDRYFRNMEFTDDDEGALFRRNGYKQILMRDTFCHHFGSVTLGDAQRKNNTLEKGRQLYFEKHGFDPWMLGLCYDLNVIKSLDIGKTGHVNILGIDAGLGSTPLQIKNELRHKGNRDVHLYHFTTEEQFVSELKQYSDFLANGKIENLNDVFGGVQFDYIYFGKEIELYNNYEEILQNLKRMLHKDGELVVNLNNLNYIGNLYNTAHLQTPASEKKADWPDANRFVQSLEGKFTVKNILAVQTEIPSYMLPYYDSLIKSNGSNEEVGLVLKTAQFQFYLKARS
jgi:GT2 family glycosyltransferase